MAYFGRQVPNPRSHTIRKSIIVPFLSLNSVDRVQVDLQNQKDQIKFVILASKWPAKEVNHYVPILRTPHPVFDNY